MTKVITPLVISMLAFTACSPETKPYRLVSVTVVTDSTGGSEVFTSTEELKAANDSEAAVQGFKLYHLIQEMNHKNKTNKSITKWFKVVNEQNDSLSFQLPKEQQNKILRSIRSFSRTK